MRPAMLVTCVVVMWASTGCGPAARSMAKQGTEGALEAIQEQKEQKAPEEQATEDALARRNAEQIARGMMDAVTRPEGAGPPSETSAPGGPGGVPIPPPVSLPGTGGSGSFSSSLATQVARGLSAELERQLGPDGQGPLGQSLSATAGNMATSMVEQSRAEWGSLFPECEGLMGAERQGCRDATLTRFGSALSQGMAGGLVRALQPWLLGLAFLGGVLAGLLVFLSVSVVRLRREADSARGPRGHPRPA